MKAVIQRVSQASVKVDEKTTGEIEKGFLIFLGVADGDTEKDIEKLMKKIPYLRIFEDENEKMNLSQLDINASDLVVSQITLLDDSTHGRRPNFIGSAPPETANDLYDKFCTELEKSGVLNVQKGIFGADMKVSLLNDGPVTIIIDSKELK